MSGLVKDPNTGEVRPIMDDQIVDPSHLRAALQQGALTWEGNVSLVGPNKELGEIDPNKDPGLVAEILNGENPYWRLATKAEVDDVAFQEKYGGQNLKAFGEGVARGATGGLSDVGLRASGAVEPEDLRLRQEYNPVLSTVGELGGAVGGAVLGEVPGVVGAAAKLLPASLLSRGATAAGGKIAGALASRAAAPAARAIGKTPINMTAEAVAAASSQQAPVSAFEGMASRVAGGVVAGAAEGAGFGAAKILSDQAMDIPVTAESVVAHLGGGVLFGGTLGGAIPAVTSAGSYVLQKSGVTKWAREGIKNAYARVTGQTLDDAVADVVAKTSETEAREVVGSMAAKFAQLHGANPEQADIARKLVMDSEFARKAVQSDEVVNAVRPRIKAAVDSFEGVLGRAEMEGLMRKRMKAPLVRGLVEGPAPVEAYQEAGSYIEELAHLAYKAKKAPDLYGGEENVAKLGRMIEDYAGRLGKKPGAKGQAELISEVEAEVERLTARKAVREAQIEDLGARIKAATLERDLAQENLAVNKSPAMAATYKEGVLGPRRRRSKEILKLERDLHLKNKNIEQLQRKLRELTGTEPDLTKTLPGGRPTARGNDIDIELSRAQDRLNNLRAGVEEPDPTVYLSREAAAEQFLWLDSLKKDLGDLATQDNPNISLQAQDMFERVRKHLENRSYYGKGAEAQSEINAHLSAYLVNRKRFDAAFMSGSGRQNPENRFREIKVFDDRKADAWYRQYGTAQGKVKDDVFVQHMGSYEGLLKDFEKYYELDDLGGVIQEHLNVVLPALSKDLTALKSVVGARNQFLELEEATRNGIMGRAANILAGGNFDARAAKVAVGHALGIPFAGEAAIFAAAQASRNQASIAAGIGLMGLPPPVVRMLAVGARMQEAVGNAAVRMVEKGTSRTVGRRIRFATLNALSDAFTATVSAILSGQAETENQAATLARGLEAHTPELAGAVIEAGTRAPQWLAGKIPPGALPDPTAIGPDAYRVRPVSPAEMSRFMRYVHAAMDLPGAYDAVGTKSITPEQIETMRVLTPANWAVLNQNIAALVKQKELKIQADLRALGIRNGMRLTSTMDVSLPQMPTQNQAPGGAVKQSLSVSITQKLPQRNTKKDVGEL